MRKYDAVVIGGGPAGVSSVLYLARAGVELLWIEKASTGGQILLTEWIDNYPGFAKGIRGYELADAFDAHLKDYKFDKIMDEVSGIDHSPGRNVIRVGGEEIEAAAVVICSGAKFRKLSIPGEERLTGRGVSYCALCDGNFFRNQVVATVGGGDTALEESLYLARLASKVYLIHRRDAFRGTKLYQDKVMAEGKIEVIFDTVCTEVLGEKDVEALALKNVKTGAESRLDVSGVFIFVGHEPGPNFFPAGIERDKAGFIVTDAEMNTGLPGIFAAGDVRSKNVRQVATAVGDGVTAAVNAHTYLEKIK